jgi:hypothetical protein
MWFAAIFGIFAISVGWTARGMIHAGDWSWLWLPIANGVFVLWMITQTAKPDD